LKTLLCTVKLRSIFSAHKIQRPRGKFSKNLIRKLSKALFVILFQCVTHSVCIFVNAIFANSGKTRRLQHTAANCEKRTRIESRAGSRIFRVIRCSRVFSCRVAYTWKFGCTLCGWKMLERHLHARILSHLVTLPCVCLWRCAIFSFFYSSSRFYQGKTVFVNATSVADGLLAKYFWSINCVFKRNLKI